MHSLRLPPGRCILRSDGSLNSFSLQKKILERVIMYYLQAKKRIDDAERRAEEAEQRAEQEHQLRLQLEQQVQAERQRAEAAEQRAKAAENGKPHA